MTKFIEEESDMSSMSGSEHDSESLYSGDGSELFEQEDDLSEDQDEPVDEQVGSGLDEASMTGSEAEEILPVVKKSRPLGELTRKLLGLEEQIAQLESQQVQSKHWTLTGEVTAKNRPMNSLLDANVELPFGHMAGKRLDDSVELMADENDFDPENPERPSFFDIELIIRQRVADRTFDDILKRKIDTTVSDVQKPADAWEGLNFEKSQLGLADVYAKQYEKDIFNQSADSEKVSAEKEEARRLFAKLMHKLDSLTNFNFAPRPPAVKKGGDNGAKDLPAMKLEEAIPIVMSTGLRAATSR